MESNFSKGSENVDYRAYAQGSLPDAVGCTYHLIALLHLEQH